MLLRGGRAFSTRAIRTVRLGGPVLSTTSKSSELAKPTLISSGIPHGLSCSCKKCKPVSTIITVRQWSSGPGAKVVVVPGMGDSITEGSLEKWIVAPGTSVAEDEPICSIETDKINHEIRAPFSGVVSDFKANEKDIVKVGQELFTIVPGAAAPKAAAPPPQKEKEKEKPQAETPKQAPPPPPQQQKPASAPAQAQAHGQSQGQGQAPKPAPSVAAPGSEKRVPMSRMRLRIAERLKDSQNTAAMLTTFNEIDMYELINMRAALKDEFNEKHGVKLGFMGAFVKASANALKAIPTVNAAIDGTDILYREYADISVAVATPKGLVTPVIRDADKMSIAEIEKEIGRLGKKARDGQISLEDLAGGTFTISNGGVFGSMMGTPIINPPQSAILGMHATNDRPHVVNGEIKIRPVMYVALTYDHRLIDGREAVTFLRTIKLNIEDPRRMLLEL